MKRTIIASVSILCLACNKTPQPTTSTTPIASATVTAASSVTPNPTQTAALEVLGDPALPTDAGSFLVPLPAWTSADRDGHPWWTASGISDNALRAFVSDLEPAEAEAKLIAFLELDTRQPLPETPGFFEVEDSRLAVYAKPDDTYGVAALVSPLAQPPKAWDALGLPPLAWAEQSALLEGKKSVVVIFSGHGSTDFLHNAAKRLSNPTTTPTP